jgi:hypothetical protein
MEDILLLGVEHVWHLSECRTFNLVFRAGGRWQLLWGERERMNPEGWWKIDFFFTAGYQISQIDTLR